MICRRCFLVAAVLLSIHGPSARAAVLEAGAAKTDITPPLGCPMWGFFDRKDKPSIGVRDPLQARALVLAVGADRLALVSLDLGRAPPRAVTNSLRTRLKTAVGIEHLFLVGSHTHCGPVLELDDVPAGKPYLPELEEKLYALVVAAAQARQPARLGIASKEVLLNVNRHSKHPDPPLDRELLLLRVENTRDGKLVAHAVNYQAHATLLGSSEMRWSADWPGVMATQVEKETGAPCLFLQGACGDLTIDRNRGRTPEIFGQAMAKEVLAAAHGLRTAAPAIPTLQLVEEDFHFASRLRATPRTVDLASAHFPKLRAFYEREYQAGVRPHLTVALLNGRIGLVGVSGEVFCAHALRLRQRAQLERLFFLGYCNDHHRYLPTIEAVAEGGYGTEPYSAPAEIGAGERIVDRALIHLYQMRGRLK